MARYLQSLSWSDFRRRLELDVQDLLRDELDYWDVPCVYVVSDLETLQDFSGCHGFTSGIFSAEFKTELDARFVGHAPGFFLNVSGRPPLADEFAAVATTAIHELAHVFQRDLPADFYRSEFYSECVREARAKPQESIPASDCGVSGFDFQRQKHGPDFVRPLVHLALRAEARGWKFNRRKLANWELFGMPFETHQELLTNDIKQCEGKPLQYLHQVAPDWQYTAVWEHNADRISKRYQAEYELRLQLRSELQEIASANND